MIHFFENQQRNFAVQRKAKFRLKIFKIKLAFADSIKSKIRVTDFLLVPAAW
jgi:hypothetical protein